MTYSELEAPDVRYPPGCCEFVHSKIGGAIKGVARGVARVAGKAAPFAGLIPGIGSLAGPILGKLGDFAKNNPELIVGGISAIQNARTQGKRDEIRDELLANSRVDRTRRQGFLNQIDVKGLRGVRAPDLGSVFADPNNPFFRSGRTPDPAATGVVNPAAVPVTSGIKGAIKKSRRARG